MTRQPVPIHERLPATIKAHITALKLHTQQITTLQSQAAATTALVPGDWEDILMTAGWSALSGFIPPQVRILQNGMSQLIGHITGGTTANGTVIGTLTSGFFNTVHAHTFAANAVAGAAAVSHAGALGNTAGALSNTAGSLSDLDSSPNSPAGSNPTPTSGAPGGSYSSVYLNALAGNVNTLAAYVSALAGAFNTGNSLHGSGTTALASGATALTSGATATAVNMNSPTITLSTAGVLTIQNVDPNVTTLSFSELIPLITA
jgi:hypothetical protein